nr:MAG TPA: hypothetical protein [Crassvirales sp.]
MYSERESNPQGHYWPRDFQVFIVTYKYSDYVITISFDLGCGYIVSTHL